MASLQDSIDRRNMLYDNACRLHGKRDYYRALTDLREAILLSIAIRDMTANVELKTGCEQDCKRWNALYRQWEEEREQAEPKESEPPKAAAKGQRPPADTANLMEQPTRVIRVSDVSFDSIGGMTQAKKAFFEEVFRPLRCQQIYLRMNRPMKGAILLYGPPGTGKTMFAQAAAAELHARLIPVNCAQVCNPYNGMDEINIHRVFTEARGEGDPADMAVIFFDEMEVLFGQRKDTPGSAVRNERVSQFLQEIDGVEKLGRNVVLMGATNHPEMIDSAVLRPGRFSRRIFIDLPDAEARRWIMNDILSDLYGNGVVLRDFGETVPDPHRKERYCFKAAEGLSERTEGCSGADIKNLFNLAKDKAITRFERKHGVNTDIETDSWGEMMGKGFAHLDSLPLEDLDFCLADVENVLADGFRPAVSPEARRRCAEWK